jgi:hypothetical protein
MKKDDKPKKPIGGGGGNPIKPKDEESENAD